jgi:flagellin
MTVVNTNIKSLVAANAMAVNERNLQNAMTQLSTGSRINSARDDAAGLAISSKMTAQINGLNQAVRNANDGISLLQTTEGATQEMSNMLQRMRELAVQAANDSNTGSDRTALNSEFQQLAREITRIATNTQWNGMSILNNTQVGTGGTLADPTVAGTAVRNVKFQVGANADQTISIALKDFSFGSSGSPIASEKTTNLNYSGTNLKNAKQISVVIGTKTFSTTLSAAIATSFATTAEVSTIKTALSNLITGTAGYEGVSVTATGQLLDIKDASGRAIGSLTAALAAGSAVTIHAAATTSVATGTTGGAASAPAASAVFSGSARLNDKDLSSQTAANSAITAVDAALAAVDSERSTMGAVMSRLSHAADNLSSVVQNATASRSRILDADYAAVTTALSKAQIIQQAATAMLAQANQQPQTVLALLK